MKSRLFFLLLALLVNSLKADECETIFQYLRDRYGIVNDNELSHSISESLNWSLDETVARARQQHAGGAALIYGVPLQGSWDDIRQSYEQRKATFKTSYDEALKTRNFTAIWSDLLNPSAAEIYRECKQGVLTRPLRIYLLGNERGEFKVWVSYSSKVDGGKSLARRLQVEEFTFDSAVVKFVGGTLRRGISLGIDKVAYGTFHRVGHSAGSITIKLEDYSAVTLSLKRIVTPEVIFASRELRNQSLRVIVEPNWNFATGFNYDVKGDALVRNGKGREASLVFRVNSHLWETDLNSNGASVEDIMLAENFGMNTDPEGTTLEIVHSPVLRIIGGEHSKGPTTGHDYGGNSGNTHPHIAGSRGMGSVSLTESGTVFFDANRPVVARKTIPVILPEGQKPNTPSVPVDGKPTNWFKRLFGWD